jgi:FtsP/CotA-like multicopper oxidase with cupredoxin domain
MSTRTVPVVYGPYSNPDADNSDDTGLPGIANETTLTATLETVNIGGVSVHAEVFNGGIPGPTFKLNVGQSMVVRLINKLPYQLGIHWHGVELENYSDGTDVTQDGAAPSPAQLIGGAPAGGTFLYKFKVTRAGLFWYHPHHGNSINRVFRGLYGMIIVTDQPLEAGLGSVLPADTMQLVLSDTTVCKAGTPADPNDTTTYIDPGTIATAADRAEWLMPPPDPMNPTHFSQNGITPAQLCDIATAKNDAGTGPPVPPYGAGDVPSLMGQGTPMAEGQTVLTNGMNVGGRPGTPDAPRPLPATSITRDVLSGQGLRLQIVNCAHLRYFRLRLTRGDDDPALAPLRKVDLFRIGGEGGLLDHPILEGNGNLGTVALGYESGEILLPTACRADVVVAIPADAPNGSVLTLWTRDYQRTGHGAGAGGAHPFGWGQLPSVPVAHFRVNGTVAGPAYSIGVATALRAPGNLVEPLPAPPPGTLNGGLLDPSTFGKAGTSNQEIRVRADGSTPHIDVVTPMAVMDAFMDSDPYTAAPHLAGTSRYAESGRLLELKVTNESNGKAHHPFHLHGFSFQPVKLEPRVGAPAGLPTLDPWPYREFRDTIDLLPDYTLTIRVRLDDRNLADDVLPGGAMGRWLFHCHIFFHHERGMISELVVLPSPHISGGEKPNVNVGGSSAYTAPGGIATRNSPFCTFFHRDGLQMKLTASKGNITSPAGPGFHPGGNWTWDYTSAPGDPISNDYVYITAEDTDGRKDQAVFRLQVGGTDASDQGDPHLRTVDGTRYDFQAAGEFTLLRDLDGMEIQVRQTPAVTPPPIKDNYSGLTACVSLNTAAAARVGSHRISYQPWKESGRLQFFLDGKPADLPRAGMNLDAHRVSTFDAGGETGLRIDYAHGPVVTITPHFWTSYGIHYLDVDVSNTDAEQGLMGRIPKGTWLPALPSGATLGPMPDPMPGSLHDRYVALYQTFADAWRVTDATSMFMYTPGTSTATFTDRDWPPEKPPCTTVKPGFPLPVTPIKENIPIARAKRICKDVKLDDLHAFCVFDVATTGDESFAKNYLIAQELRLRATAVQIVSNKPRTRPGEKLVVTATVLPRTQSKKVPTGSITFIIDSKPVKPPIKLDKHGRAGFTVANLKLGEHKIRATYSGGGECQYHPSSSPNLLHTVTRRGYTVTKPPGGMMPMGKASTRERGSHAGSLHTVAKKKKPSPTTGRAHKKNR